MKRIISLFLCLILMVLAAACGKTGDTQNSGTDGSEEAITMAIALGNGEQYTKALVQNIKDDLGIEVELVYQISSDTTSYTRLCFKNNEMPADIVFTASKTPDEYLKDCCLDLLSETSVTTNFTYKKLQECVTQEGAIYQLPVTSKLIGITYNETLLNELGLDVPETFDDMVRIKGICDAKGIPFAVCDGMATGHGFNWLFHLMGSQWLSTTDGTEWFEKFKVGEASIDEFKKECEYFRKWKEAGLFGTWYDQDWLGAEEFKTTRALFWYGITNSISSYDGPEYETGKELHDIYKTMPWISEDGTNNCFTTYDNCWVTVSKELKDAGNEKKLNNVTRIIDYLTEDKAIGLATDMAKDIYVPTKSFNMTDDRLYGAYAESINNGFVQPWYYNYFSNDSIVKTGEAVNSYISDSGVSFDEIFTTLEKTNREDLNGTAELLFTAEEKLGFKETAEILAISGAISLQKSLDENETGKEVQVSLVPYTENPNELPPWRNACVVNTLIYQGNFESTSFNTIIPAGATVPCGIYMTGKQIKDICNGKFDPSSRFIDQETGESTFDSENYGPYPYVCIVKNGSEINDADEYLVCVAEKMLTAEQYQAFADAGKIVDMETHTYADGLKMFGEQRDSISGTDITWQ